MNALNEYTRLRRREGFQDSVIIRMMSSDGYRDFAGIDSETADAVIAIAKAVECNDCANKIEIDDRLDCKLGACRFEAEISMG
jgi:hypothetical protein